MSAFEDLHANREANQDAIAALEVQQSDQAAALAATERSLSAQRKSSITAVANFLGALKDEPELYRAYFGLQWGEQPIPTAIDEADTCLRLIYKIHGLAESLTAFDTHLRTAPEPVSVLAANPEDLRESHVGARALSLKLTTPKPGEGLAVAETGRVYDVAQGYVSRITDIRIASSTIEVDTHHTGFDDTISFLSASSRVKSELVIAQNNRAANKSPEQFSVSRLDQTSGAGITPEGPTTYYVGTTDQLLHLIERTPRGRFDGEVIRYMAQHLHAQRDNET